MSTTPKGFTVLNPDSKFLATFKRSGKSFTVHEDTVKPFSAFVEYFDLVVEPLDEAGWEGGYSHRKVAGSTKWSEHAAGMAIDLNASQHGRTAASGFTRMQINAIEWFLGNTASGRLMEWGGHWKNKDWMHFEIKSPELLAAYVKEYGRA